MTTSPVIASLSRRAILAAPLALPAVAGEASDAPNAAGAPASDTLVAYYSRTGNTRVIAGQIRRARNAELFEIRTASPYPEDYEQTVEQARRETDAGFEPPLRAVPIVMAGHRTIYLGFPIWGQTAPPAIRSFLKAYDWSGKTIRPFVTHGGYGLGTSLTGARSIGQAIVGRVGPSTGSARAQPSPGNPALTGQPKIWRSTP